MSQPLAYLITWTCYGTWLHGDQRGSVDNEHNAPDTPLLPPDASRTASNSTRLRNAPVELGAQARTTVEKTIVAHCQHRGWEIMALNVRTHHVHLVVGCVDIPPECMLSQLKAWTTRRLREAGSVSADARVWTHHGSTRYLWNKRSVEAAINYVTDHQGADLPKGK